MLDIFRSDAFSVTSLTDAILKAPYKPGRIGELGLFRESGITTTSVVIEEKSGQLSLIQSSPRGGVPSTLGAAKRTARSFLVPHLERVAKIMADEAQNVRAFGSDNSEVAVQQLVNDRLAELRAMHEVTLEHMRASAIQGVVLDADGTTLFDLFTQFGVVQQTQAVSKANPRPGVIAAQRQAEAEIGGDPVSGYRAICGDTFFDDFIDSAGVKETLKYQEGAQLRTNLRKGFEFGGVTWENYRGKNGATPYFPDAEAYLIPEGPSIFRTYFAPADFIEAVNTVGLPVYAKQAPDPQFNRYVEILTQSNPLAICIRPRAVIKLTLAA